MMGEGKWPGKSAQLVEFFHVVRVPWSEIDRKSMKQFQTSFFQFLAVLAKKIWKIKSKKNPPNIMALPNPFQNTFNAPPWPSQVDPSKFGCIWTPRNDFFDGLCIAHRKKSPAARANRQQRQRKLHWMVLGQIGSTRVLMKVPYDICIWQPYPTYAYCRV